MGRLIAVVAVRRRPRPRCRAGPRLGSGGRPAGVAAAAVEFAEPTAGGHGRGPARGRRNTRAGCAGWASCSGSPPWWSASSSFAEASVFLWVPAARGRLLLGVLLAEDYPAAAAVAAGRPAPPAAPLRADLAVAAVDDARGRRRRGGHGGACMDRARRALDRVVPVALRAARRRLAAGRGRAAAHPGPAAARRGRRRARSTRRCAPGPRTWSPPPPACWALLPLGALLLAGRHRARGPDHLGLRPAARWHWSRPASRRSSAGLAVAGFLLTWLRPVRLVGARTRRLTHRRRAGTGPPPSSCGLRHITHTGSRPSSAASPGTSTTHVSACPRSATGRSASLPGTLHLAPCSLSCRDRRPGWRHNPGGVNRPGLRHRPTGVPFSCPGPVSRGSVVRRSLQFSLFAVVLVGLVGGLLACFMAQKSLTLTVDGQSRTVHTYAGTVADVLRGGGAEDGVARRRPARRRTPRSPTATPWWSTGLACSS